MKKTLLIIATILLANSIAYSQATETKQVKVSVLKAMGKDLEKCKLLQTAFDLKTANFDSLVNINIKLFNDLERQQSQRLELQNRLQSLKEDYNKALKQQKKGWVIPGLVGVVGGLILGTVL